MWNPPGSSARRRLCTVLGHLSSSEIATEACSLLSASPCASDRLRIEPIAGCTLGAVVQGVTLGDLDEETFQVIEKAFHEHAVLVFPGQGALTKEQQDNFGRRFGALEFEAIPMSNQDANGQVISSEEARFKTCRINENWHTDSTYMPVSAKAGLLYAEGPIPSKGGATEFADMRAAYDALEDSQKAKIEKLAAYHSVHYSYASLTNFFPEKGTMYGLDGTSRFRPLVKVHPVTGRKSIFYASHAFGIPNMTREDSKQLLNSLRDFACQAPRTYEHHWQVGDLVLWDNRCCLHRARPYDTKEKRVMRGTRIAGEKETELELPAPDAAKVLAAELDRLRSENPSHSSSVINYTNYEAASSSS
eukprot:gnl/MRDRNA2_/MRDRNA2_66709_c0_seq2.p1 gnl/MRDRNA2_/MRDRNA2_66709_c0~~gnl/MRDRNA2_/MRDRNA2_66709_c0_seq2.p1  ORF type:complete len:361 (+),score=48.49 gnl/MRDRNA2_/MRDRNA2_66709_c0_seq2:104-1186(+)